MKKCSECGDKCEKPYYKAEMSFKIVGAGQYDVAAFDDGKQFCCGRCMMKALTKEVKTLIRRYPAEYETED